MSNCLVLGANGFLGSHLVNKLSAEGHFVRCFDRYPDEHTRFKKNDSTELFAGEFLNEADIEKSLENIDYVFHFISTTTPISSDKDPVVEIDTNIRGSVLLFEKCVEQGVKRVIYSSSGGAVYGNKMNGLINEDMLPEPFSPYAIGKLTVEHYLRYFHVRHELDSVVYRISNPYGPGQSLTNKQGVIPIFLNHLLKELPITVYGDGSMVRDYLYVDDAISMITDSFQEVNQPLYNIGSAKGYSVNNIIKVIEEVTGREFSIIYESAPKTFVSSCVLDNSRFVSEFGQRNFVPLKEGIELTWKNAFN